MSEKRITENQQNAEEGIFGVYYGSEWFVKIKPAFGTNGKGIDRVLFAFVNFKKDKETKKVTFVKSFDIYMHINIFDIWADDILSGRFMDIINKEAAAGESYPKYYKFETGTSNEKSVGFMYSSKKDGPAINASDIVEGRKVYATLPLDEIWLRSIAKQFQRTVAPRYLELDSIMMKAANSYSHEIPPEDDDMDSVPVIEEEEEKKSVTEPKIPLTVERSLIWCLDKGSVMENRGKDATVFRVVTVCVSDDEPNRIPATKKGAPDYEVVDAVFYTKSVTKAELGEDFMNYCKQASEGKKSFQTKGLNFKVGDIRDGFRQLIFTA